MLQSADSTTQSYGVTRAQWMALLARAPLNLLEKALGDQSDNEPLWLRKPETGLMMIQARAGGTGERFNLGEITITRCALRLPDAQVESPVGISYVLGRSHKHARLAAMLDAIFLTTTDPAFKEKTLNPIRQHLQEQRTEREQRTATSKVEFFTVARESGANDESEE